MHRYTRLTMLKRDTEILLLKLLSPHERRTPLWTTQCYFFTLRNKYLDHLCGWFWNKILDRNCGRFSKPLGAGRCPYKLKEMAQELQKTTRYFGKLLVHGSKRSPYIFLKIKAQFKKKPITCLLLYSIKLYYS